MVPSLKNVTTLSSSHPSNNAKSKDVPNDVKISESLEVAMTSQKSSRVTPAEQQKFLSGMKDPKFQLMLNEYMQEISDIPNCTKTKQYMSQLDNEHKIPMDKQLVQPKPGFVVKTKWDTTHKVFVNVCSSDKMQPPPSTNMMADQQKTPWNLPYVMGPERLETDKGGAGVPTFDVCFHLQVVEFAMARADYRHMVISTCLDAIELSMRDSRCKPTALLARKYHILKGVFYKSGDPITICLRKDREVTELAKPKEKSEVQAKKTKVDLSRGKITMFGDKKPSEVVSDQDDDLVLNELTHVEQTDDSTPLVKEVSSIDLDPKQQLDKSQQKKKMEYRLIHRGRPELLDHMQADPDNQVPGDRYRPKELVVEVSFPFSSSAKGIDLDVSERMLRLSAGASVVGDYEPLELALPFPVFGDKGCARFDRKKRKLVVTLPVQPPPKPQSFSLIVRDDDEEEEEDKELPLNIAGTSKSSEVLAPKQKTKGEDDVLMLRETAQAMAHNQRKAQRHPPAAVTRSSPAAVTELAAIKDEVFDALPPLKSCGSEEIDTSELHDDEIESSFSVSTPIELASEAVDPIMPCFETHDTLECLSYIVNVAGIDTASVILTFPSNGSLHLQFSDSNKRVYEMHVAIFPVDIDPSTAKFDVASENMVVILHKKHAATAFASRFEKVERIDDPAPVPTVAAKNQLLDELD